MTADEQTFTLTLPARLADRIEQALQADHSSLQAIVLRWLLRKHGQKHGPGVPLPVDYFVEKEMKTLDLTLPAEFASQIPAALAADQLTLERIVIAWLLQRSQAASFPNPSRSKSSPQKGN